MRSILRLAAFLLATLAVLVDPPPRSRAQDTIRGPVSNPRYCEPPPSGRSVEHEEYEAAVLTLRVGSESRPLASCSGARARCSVRGSWPRGTHDVELRCQDWSWQGRVAFDGREQAIDASTVLGDPSIVLHGPPTGLRMELEAPRDGLAILPGRPQGLFLINRRRAAISATAHLESWYAGNWAPPELVGWPGHGYWLPEPVIIAPGDRVRMPLFHQLDALHLPTRYRVVAEAFTVETAGPLRVRRLSTLTLERTGAELVAR